MKKGAKDLNRHISKEDIQMENTPMKRCSLSDVIGELQTDVTNTIAHLLDQPTANTRTIPNAGEVVEQQEL